MSDRLREAEWDRGRQRERQNVCAETECVCVIMIQ